MFSKIFKYIDRLFNTVKPKKLLYMAIDGMFINFAFRNETTLKQGVLHAQK
jgi:hypothetical protein